MRTLDQIKGACKIEPGDSEGEEHWLWQGAMRSRKAHASKTPCVWAPDFSHDPNGVMRVQSVARAIVHIQTGKPIPANKFPFRLCSHDRCVNPACYTKPITMGAWGRMARARGLLLQRHDYTASNRKTWDTRGRKWSNDVVQQIVLSGKTGRELEEQLGIDANYANTIRRGDARKSAGMGMFSSLLK